MSTLVGQSRLPEVDGNRPKAVYSPSGGTLALIGLVLTAALVLVYWQFFRAQVLLAIAKPSDWGHTFVVPLISIWFVWLRRDDLLAKPLKPTWAGALFIVLGVVIYMLGAVGPKQLIHHLVRAVGVFSTVLGVIVLLGGWHCLRVVSFPLFYAFAFGVVISDRIMTPITNELQDLSAKGAWLLLSLLSFDVDLRGNTLTLYRGSEGYDLNVAEACSGMRMLVAFLALGTAMAYLGLSRIWQRTLLIVLGVPVAIFVNVLRVASLGLLSQKDVNFAAGEFHTFIGLVWLVPAFLVFLILMWIVRKSVVEPPRTDNAPAVSEDARLSFLTPLTGKVATVLVVLIAGAATVRAAVSASNTWLEKKSIPLTASLDTVPLKLANWNRIADTPPYDAAILESLGTNKYIDRIYANEMNSGSAPITVHLAYYTGTIDDVPHIPERCWDAAGLNAIGDTTLMPITLDDSGWRVDEVVNVATGSAYQLATVTHPITGRDQDVRLPVGELELMTTVFEDPTQPDIRRVGGYFFIANGRVTPSSFGVRNLAFNWTEEYAYYCKVQFSATYKLSQDGRDFLDQYMAGVTEICQELLPQIMRCLPDWADIESGNHLESDTQTEAVVN